jgi:hypothetical protein
MRLFRFLVRCGVASALCVLLAVPGFARAAVIGVFSTGVDAAGSVLSGGTLGDPHFTLISAPSGVDPQLKIWSAASGFPVAPAGPWLADNTRSRWIGLDTMFSDGLPHSPLQGGTYIFRTTLDLTGTSATNAVLNGKWAADNVGSIVLNGVNTGVSNNTGLAFFALTDFSLNSGFVAGVNTLDFIVTNTYSPDSVVYNPVGLRVEFTDLSLTMDSPTSPVPEPPVYQMLLTALAAGVLLRRRKSALPWYAGLSLSVALLTPGLVAAASVGVFNTGVDTAGNVLQGGTLGDPHFTLVSAPSGVDPQLKIWSAASGFPVAPFGPWLGDDTRSRWIGLDAMYSDGPPHAPTGGGTYVFRTTFDLTGFDPASAAISGRWGADNRGSILLNGASTGGSNDTGLAFFALTDFSIDRGFVAGLNTLDFVVDNTYSPDTDVYNPVGLRVEFTGASATEVPEPPAAPLVLAALAILGADRRRRRRAVTVP